MFHQAALWFRVNGINQELNFKEEDKQTEDSLFCGSRIIQDSIQLETLMETWRFPTF